MRIKNKTGLRSYIKRAAGSLGQWDDIEFYEDGSWAIMGCSSRTDSYVHRVSIGRMMVHDREWSRKKMPPSAHLERNITDNLHDIETGRRLPIDDVWGQILRKTKPTKLKNI